MNPNSLTTISRTQTVDGFSVPGLILNDQYHFTDIQVYHDGLVYCWDMLDLDLFKSKLASNWVVTSIPNGKQISVHGLGSWVVREGEWIHDKNSFYQYIYSLIETLNPKLENLYNCHGTTTKKINNVNVSVFPVPNAQPYYIAKEMGYFSEREIGSGFNVFFRDDDARLYLAELSIYKNGRVEITHILQKKVFDLLQIQKLFDNQIIKTNVAPGERISIVGLGSFFATEGHGVDIESKYNEILDKYAVLNGEEDSLYKCRKVFTEYNSNPTIALRDKLKEAYERIPKHNRMYIGDMDTKDAIVRLIIYGEKEKKIWEAKYGYKFPYGDVPKPIDGN